MLENDIHTVFRRQNMSRKRKIRSQNDDDDDVDDDNYIIIFLYYFLWRQLVNLKFIFVVFRSHRLSHFTFIAVIVSKLL